LAALKVTMTLSHQLHLCDYGSNTLVLVRGLCAHYSAKTRKTSDLEMRWLHKAIGCRMFLSTSKQWLPVVIITWLQ